MKKIITLTHILFPFFGGGVLFLLIVGRFDKIGVWAFFLVADIVLGCILQYFVDKKEEEKAKEIITEMFKESIKQEILERGEELITTNQTKFYDERKALIDIHVKINELGLENFNSNKTLQGQAISFYKSIVSKLPYGGQKLAHENIMDVVAEDVGNNFVLVYECDYLPYVMCQNAQVILVETENKGIRVFTLETSFMGYVLCEYTGTAHNNYGSVDANSFRPLLLDIINND